MLELIKFNSKLEMLNTQSKPSKILGSIKSFKGRNDYILDVTKRVNNYSAYIANPMDEKQQIYAAYSRCPVTK